MRKTAILIALLLSLQCLYADNFERILTETSSIQIALAINPDVLECSHNVEYASQKVKETKALYFPNIALNANVSKFNNHDPMLISENSSQFLAYLPIGQKDIYFAARLSVWEHIYTGGQIKATNKLAKINMDKITSEKNIVKSKVIHKVKVIFNDCLYHKELLNYYNSKIKKAENKKIRLTRVEFEDLNKKISLERFKYEKEFLNLLNAIGTELNTIAGISGALKPKIKNFDIDKCMLLAYQFKSEIKATQYQETLDSLALKLASMQKYPNVFVSATHEFNDEFFFGDGKGNWYISINANMPLPIFNGSLIAKIKQGRIKVRKATIQRSRLESEIRLNVNKSLLEYNFWKQQADSVKLHEKDGQYDETDFEIIHNLNKSYYDIELAVGVELDTY